MVAWRVARPETVPVMVTLRLPQRPWRSSQDRYPHAIRGGPPAVVTWVAQTFLQMVLLSVIMVDLSAARLSHLWP